MLPHQADHLYSGKGGHLGSMLPHWADHLYSEKGDICVVCYFKELAI